MRIEKPAWIAELEAKGALPPDRLEQHMAEPHISYAKHSQDRRLELGKAVAHRHCIYLDLKYWIFCRDAAMGCPKHPEHLEIWERLRSLTERRLAICPVSYPILCETLKQGDLTRRRAMASLIDQLSGGVAVQPFMWLIFLELWDTVSSAALGNRTSRLSRENVWTFASYLVGEPLFSLPSLDDSTLNGLRKSLFDLMTAAPFAEVVRVWEGRDLPPQSDTPELLDELNANLRPEGETSRSLHDYFVDEVAGCLDANRDIIRDVMKRGYDLFEGAGPKQLGEKELAECVRQFSNLVFHAFKLKKWTARLPFIHIQGGIHAAMRFRRQRYKPGDYWDFKHAHPALAYCDAFLTEKKLANLVCSVPLKFDEVYGCRVLWREADVVEYLRGLDSQGAS